MYQTPLSPLTPWYYRALYVHNRSRLG